MWRMFLFLKPHNDYNILFYYPKIYLATPIILIRILNYFVRMYLSFKKKKVSLVLSHTPYLYERMYVDRCMVNPISHLSERAPRLFGVCIRQGAGPEALHCVRVNLCSLGIVRFWLCQKWTLDPKRSQKTFPPVTSTKCWQFLSTTPLPEGVHVCYSGYCKP